LDWAASNPSLMDRSEANSRGKPIGEQVPADARGRDDERDCSNHPV
jgi:hypothetical protein